MIETLLVFFAPQAIVAVVLIAVGTIRGEVGSF
jgi:hypothetical protein